MIKNNMSIIIIVLLIVTQMLAMAYVLKSAISKIQDNRTEQLCIEYALRDHRLEIGEERFEWLSRFGNPNDVEFFYQSCIGHITGVPATKEYMK